MEKSISVTPAQAKEIYADLRKYRLKEEPTTLAVEWYWNNKPEVREMFAHYLKGFVKVMSVCHTFWSSRGERTKNDLEREDREQSYALV